MSKAAAFEKQWKKTFGDKATNPNSLWEKLDAIRASQGVTDKPPNSFTAKEWAGRYQCTYDAARKQIERLEQAKKVRRVGKAQNGTVYFTVS